MFCIPQTSIRQEVNKPTAANIGHPTATLLYTAADCYTIEDEAKKRIYNLPGIGLSYTGQLLS